MLRAGFRALLEFAWNRIRPPRPELDFEVQHIQLIDYGGGKARTVLDVDILVRNKSNVPTNVDGVRAMVEESDRELVPGSLDPRSLTGWASFFEPVSVDGRASEPFSVRMSSPTFGLIAHTNPIIGFVATDTSGSKYPFQRRLLPTRPPGHKMTEEEYAQALSSCERKPFSIDADALDALDQDLERMRYQKLEGYEQRADDSLYLRITTADLEDLTRLKDFYESRLNDRYRVAWGYFLGQVARAYEHHNLTGESIMMT